MKHTKENKKKVVYFSDDINEDFANNNIKRKKIDENYKYENNNIFFKIFSFWFRYFFALPILWFIDKFIYRVKIKNKEVLKRVKNSGYYMYSNHVISLDPIIAPIMIDPFKYCVIAASHDTFSINKFVSFLVKALGAIPVPSSSKMYQNYVRHMSKHIYKKHRVLIYPEQHIWPYYNDIRNFKSGSFRYPVDDNAPIITLTTTFKKSKIFKTPNKIIYIDGPFYPDTTLDRISAVNDLRNKAYEAMKNRANTPDNYAYIEYKKKEILDK
jgi:1-acyl-sn-glycerol-3-phosphate acyltransferase